MRYTQPQSGAAFSAAFRVPGAMAYIGGHKSAIGAKYAEYGGANGISNIPALGGIAMSTADANKAVGLSPVPNKLMSSGVMTWVYQFVCPSTTTGYRCFGAGDNNGSYVEEFDVSMDHNGTDTFGKFRFILRSTGGATSIIGSTNVVFTSGKLHTIVIVYKGNSTFEAWVDGVSVALSNTGFFFNESSPGPMPQATHYSVGNFFYGLSDVSGNAANKTLLFARIPAALDGRSISNNPWKIFADNKKPIFIGVGAAPSGLSITAELAAASASGYAATVNLQSAISSTVATATASGFTANVSTGNAITATLATTTASGQTATVNRQSNITATQAAASASGNTATVNRQLAIAATLATATASGQTATVNIQRSVAATQAAATATGYTANVQLGNDLSISATQAAATASGFDAAINRQLSIAATLATATASGFDASISNGASIAASYGLASADGYQAQVNLQREIAASLATASASGFTAAISTSTGTAVWPTPDQVLSGITYGPTGADYTGTATAGGYPTAADIAAAVRVNLSAELALIDAAISSRSTVAGILGATVP